MRPATPFGYRNAYKLVALILAVTAGIVLALYREPAGENPRKHERRKRTAAG